MAAFAEGTVVEIIDRDPHVIELKIDLGDRVIRASAFPQMLGTIEVGHRVMVNTTGIELDLGTGGEGFVLWNLDGGIPPPDTAGHIVKLRYTPWQMNVLAAEAPESPHHDALAEVTSIDSMPVVACSLHSQVAGATAGIRAARPDVRVGYLMTDGGALPLAWSRLTRALVSGGLIDATCTCGHAFGGDLEAVNVFSGLAALRHAANCDVAVVAMGPGVVGTKTRLGTTALEQGQILDAVAALDGIGVAALRVSFADERDRHRGISHHTLRVLSLVARERAVVAVPELPEDQANLVRRQLDEAGVGKRHLLTRADGSPGVDLLRLRGLQPASMGRTLEQDPAPFLAAAAAGRVAAEALR